MAYCKECFEKQLQIDQLEEENKSLKAKLRYRTDKDIQPYFGSSTPSSKIPVKQNTAAQNRAKEAAHDLVARVPGGSLLHGNKLMRLSSLV